MISGGNPWVIFLRKKNHLIAAVSIDFLAKAVA